MPLRQITNRPVLLASRKGNSELNAAVVSVLEGHTYEDIEDALHHAEGLIERARDSVVARLVYPAVFDGAIPALPVLD